MTTGISQDTRRIALVALAVLALDQFTKWIVVKNLFYGEERIVLDGFFRFVHWGNTGAAWSLFSDRNHILALVSAAALAVLYFSRHHFDAHTLAGQVALGLLFGGITGNLVDRLHVDHVIDFLRFYINRRGGGEIGFPAFNVADSAICTGVGLLFILAQRDPAPAPNRGESTPPDKTPS